MFGLDTDTIRNIKNCLAKFPQIDKALLYGSRAKGNYKNGSDIDLTLLGKNLSLRGHIYPLQGELDKLYLPYTFDLSVFSKLDNLELIEHILGVGKSFYQKEVRELPAGWERKSLGEVSKIIYGYTAKATFKREGPRFLRITDIKNNYVDWSAVPYCKISKANLSRYKLSKGDIVFARTGATTGKSYLIKDVPHSVFASYLIGVKLQGNILLPEFLYLFFQTKEYWDNINSGISGSAQGGFNATKLSNLKIPLPPQTEQKRIASVLDKVFQALDQIKANNEKNLANAKELWESCLKGVFAKPARNWEQKRLGEVCEISTGKSNTVDAKEKGKFAFFDRSKKIKKSDRFLFDCNAIIIAGEGQQFLPRFYSGKFDLHQRAYAIYDFQKTISIKYVFNYLTYFHKYFERVAVGATAKSLRLRHFQDLPIPIPPLAEQKRIVQKLDVLYQKMTELQEIYRKKIANVVELKKAVLRKAFTGEL